MRKKLMALAAAAALGSFLTAGCEKKTVTTTTESAKATEAPTPEPTVAMAETPVPPPVITPAP